MTKEETKEALQTCSLNEAILKKRIEAEQKYARELVLEYLAEQGLSGDVIRKEDGQKGIIKYEFNYSYRREWELRFVPYTKRGTLAERNHILVDWEEATDKYEEAKYER